MILISIDEKIKLKNYSYITYQKI